MLLSCRKERKKKNTRKRKELPLRHTPPSTTTAMAEIKNAYPPFVNPYKQKGRPLNYNPQQLAEEFEKYVRWCQDNPITISKTAIGQTGDTPFNREEIETKPRLVSIGGFLNWLGEEDNWWTMLDKGTFGDEFLRVKARVRGYCEDYQKAMASTGVFKENIISRLLGLADKKAVTTDGVKIVVESNDQKEAIESLGELGI